jgi:hypothetical protein
MYIYILQLLNLLLRKVNPIKQGKNRENSD